MPCYKLREIHLDTREPIPTSADLRADLLGRELTEIERAADDYQDAMRERDRVRQELRTAGMSERSKRLMGVG
jgi:uncharacterized protein (DUF3084 family)